MKSLLLFVASTLFVSIAGAAKLPSDSAYKIQGVDIRNKQNEYLLVLEKENIVLEERTFKLYRMIGNSKRLVKEGQVGYMGEDLKNDTAAIYSNEKTSLKVGRLVNSRAPKQVVVLKLKDINQTYAFEIKH